MVQSYFEIQLTDSGRSLNQFISCKVDMMSTQEEGNLLDNDIF